MVQSLLRAVTVILAPESRPWRRQGWALLGGLRLVDGAFGGQACAPAPPRGRTFALWSQISHLSISSNNLNLRISQTSVWRRKGRGRE